MAGADPGFFLGGGALVSLNTNKPHSFFFLQNTSCIRKRQVIPGEGRVRTPCTLPLDPPLYGFFVKNISAAIPAFFSNIRKPEQGWYGMTSRNIAL